MFNLKTRSLLSHHCNVTLSVVTFTIFSLQACQKKQFETSPGETNLPGQNSDPEFASIVKLADLASIESSQATPDSLSFPAPNLSTETLEKHLEGDAGFESSFISQTQSPEHRPEANPLKNLGLGPAFNNTSCINCHSRDGRGFLPPIGSKLSRVKLGPNESILVRISVETESRTTTETKQILSQQDPQIVAPPTPVPGFSTQLFHRGVIGLRPDFPGTGQADIYLSYIYTTQNYPDETKITLRKPYFEIENTYDGPKSRLYQPDVRMSPRIAPPVAGVGLLEAIPEDQILARMDEMDSDQDGISGRPNYVLDLLKSQSGLLPGQYSLGRFGWKASQPTLKQQTVAALNNDMGVTTALIPYENIQNTSLLDPFIKPTHPLFEPQANDLFVDSVTLYTQTLGIPQRRDHQNHRVKRGARLFSEIQCASCHSGPYQLGQSAIISEFRGLKIYPFTDLLLHDMGDGLADHRSDYRANGFEWKTPALWGIGVTQLVNPRAGFLHDGRARTLEEAIVWHGGEAARSRQLFMELPIEDRSGLILFLLSL